MNSPTDPDAAGRRQAVVTQALSAYTGKDAFAAVEYLCAQDDTSLALEALDALMRDCYWKQKDLEAALVFGRAGHQLASAAAGRIEKQNPAEAATLRGRAKVFTYNIASFTWPGWDEEGIDLSESHVAEGLMAARANLRLARQLERGDLPLSRAYWMLGAHELAGRDYPAAQKAFTEAANRADAAGEAGEATLAKAYRCLVESLVPKADDATAERLDQTLSDLRKHEHGESLANQVTTARQVFGRGRKG